MGVLTSFREFQRTRDGLDIPLRVDEWPADVPLPPGSSIVGVGENHELLIHPRLRYVLEPECPVEVVTGWFQASLSFEETLAWFRAELGKLGWVEESGRGYFNPPRAGLRFQHPETQVHVSITVQWWPSLNHTTAMIWRVIKRPWSPADEQPVQAGVPLPHEAEVPVPA